MKKYILNSDKYNGDVIFEYDDDGIVKLDFSQSNANQVQRRAIFLNTPFDEKHINNITEKSTAVLTEVMSNITFEDFWKRYFEGRNKDNSSKKVAMTRWNKLPKSAQLKAYNFIRVYMQNIKFGTNPKLAETYLNHEPWN